METAKAAIVAAEAAVALVVSEVEWIVGVVEERGRAQNSRVLVRGSEPLAEEACALPRILEQADVVPEQDDPDGAALDR